MKIMSFNTQHCLNFTTQMIDFDIMAKAIIDCEADIVGLNEMRGVGSYPEYTDQVKKLSELTKMDYYYFADAKVFPDNPYGNAILSKIPIIESETIIIPDPKTKIYNDHYETRCVLKAVLQNGAMVLITHMGLNADERENAVKTVLNYTRNEKCILMGDFNMSPDDSLLMPIKARMTDTAVLFDEEKLSFPSDNPVCKIDYIFVSNDINVISADIPSIVASDHRPCISTISFT